MKRFYKFIILNQEEFNLDQPLSDFGSDEYRYWGLVDLDTLEFIFLNDNVHYDGIDSYIDVFLYGVKYSGTSYCLETGCVVLNHTGNVSLLQVKEKIKKGEMYDGVL